MNDEKKRTIELEDDEVVLITNKDREIRLLIPEIDKDATVPSYVTYMTTLAILTKSDDEFVTEILSRFDEITGGKDEE